MNTVYIVLEGEPHSYPEMCSAHLDKGRAIAAALQRVEKRVVAWQKDWARVVDDGVEQDVWTDGYFVIEIEVMPLDTEAP